MECKYLSKIVDELQTFASKVQEEEVKNVCDEILKANRIFIAGAGRSGFAARAFANRLLHLGFAVSFVGEPTTPPIKKGDLLLIGSGSGTTGSLVSMVQKAVNQNATIVTITISPENTIGSMSKAYITIPGTTRQLVGDKTENSSIQPIGSVFEQLSWLVYDSLVMMLLEKTNQCFEDLLSRHANLE